MLLACSKKSGARIKLARPAVSSRSGNLSTLWSSGKGFDYTEVVPETLTSSKFSSPNVFSLDWVCSKCRKQAPREMKERLSIIGRSSGLRFKMNVKCIVISSLAIALKHIVNWFL